ncbi:rubrerythrin-like domain-containing protein [Natrinema pallidum]|uniref:DUF7129 domain-containing protein n=2 Tax=Natrinema pallidum TaxID=69527 RepID=L9YFR2_9EURY|nr:rubrerythrin-like domain-containing protein [Natrinema pallidum]ELY72516.1 hypothetical protein C487_18613 [Natrinema pallidum DSM 3751]QCW03691.1 hydrogenase maturation nickel metallochaperone HypA [Natrinema pallidum]
MVYTNPYSPDRSHYECWSCGYRMTAGSLGSCPECGGQMHNLSVPRD